MKKDNLSKNGKNKSAQSQRAPIPWRYCLLTVACGLILAAGFFFAARQHFSAIEFGIKNAKLRQQKDELENAQRQLYLAKEVALSPGEIKKSAKKIGLQDIAASGMEVVKAKVEAAASSAKKVIDEKLTPAAAAKLSFAAPDKSASESKTDKETNSKSQDSAGDNIRPRIAGK